MSEITISVSMALKTCSCGLVYAVPNWLSIYTCPSCAHRTFSSKDERIREKAHRIEQLEHINAGLRGALTRIKRTKGLAKP